uniref:AlNc14C28G2737 protein n=1 Tax=Albugo laibachii Nc14 TaxID=890382 RepID=F0W7B7_9STRA|nr:AlNc14C28G2737 [Albugo laibachii Nc14]|eukprot:CCA17016.1 AlNc14C28G2737 [Albugo laibachii Nc14]
MFTQINYTGPALSTHELAALAAFSSAFIESEARDTLNYRSCACVALHVDGEYPYNICEKLDILLLARCLLQAMGTF